MSWILWIVAASMAAEGFVEPEVELLWHAGSPAGGSFGFVLSGLGDLDGDGAMEVIASAPYQGGNSGLVRVISGRTGDGIHKWTGSANSQLGYSVADAGDVDGDGVSDAIAGAPTASEALVFSGASGEVLLTLGSGEPGDSFGASVGGAGDVDGDGRADLVVGAETSAAGGAASGRVYVHSGGTGAVLYTIEAESDGDHFGSAVAPIGDVDGDGAADLVVGARDAGPTGAGRVSLHRGTTGALIRALDGGAGPGSLGHYFVADVGDLDGDGISDVYGGDFGYQQTGRALVWSGASGDLLHSFVGSGPGEGLGPGRGAGDVDGDGIPDLAIGSWTSSLGAPNAGRITVFSGADGSVIREVTSTTAGENLGFDVVGVGDLDGDGDIELVASGATANNVYLIAGLGGTLPDDEPDPSPALERDGSGCGCSARAGGSVGPFALLFCVGLIRRRVGG